MKKSVVLLLTFVMLAFTAHARIWRVNNNPGGISADAVTLQAAHDSAASGDTIHLESSILSYGTLTCTKKLIIFGSGYFLNENPDEQALFPASTVGALTLNTGSNGTVIAGTTVVGTILISCSDIVLMRNYITRVLILGSPSANITIANILIKQNFIYVDGSSYGHPVTYYNAPVITNLLFRNNLIYQYSITGSHLLTLPPTASGIMENNIFRNYNIAGGLVISNFTLKNNIMVSGTFSGTNCNYSFNIGNSTQFGTANGNQSNVSMSNMFVGPTGNSTDGAFKLATGSPAIGAGEFGVDCGMYGGSDPYILSGMPPIPAIYYFNTNGTGNQQNIKVKVKSHN